MNRRDSVLGLLALAAAPLAVRAQPSGKTWHIGVIRPGPDDAVWRANFEPFRQVLRELGFAEGKNLAFDFKVAPGSPQELLARARELVRLNVDAILAIATGGVTASAQASSSIPIVAVDLESDPVAQKLAANLARPGGNVTGLFLDFPELSGKWLEQLKATMPKLTRVAVLYDPTISAYLLKGAEAAGKAMQVRIIYLEARSPGDLERAFQSAVRQEAEALLALSSPVFASVRKEIAALALRHRLPAIMPFPPFADDGGLMAYGPHLTSMFRQAGGVMAKILKGTAPRDIPIERPTRFEFAVNLKTAKALGLTIAPSLLVRADRVIE
jgi:putative ABC transport system substrate-binding protein